MTTRQALQILIYQASQNIKGVGCGIRSLPSDAEIEKLAEAIEKVWNRAYYGSLDNVQRYNLGLPFKEE
jgi:hypothetical protein